MELATYWNIVDQLSSIGYKGRFSPHFYDEPLLDDRMPHLMRYAREKLPLSKIVVFSNGDYLTPEKFNELIAGGVNKLFITLHGENLSPGAKEVLAANRGRKNIILNRLDDKHLSNRGGLVEIAEEKTYRPNPCYFAPHTLTIAYNGDVLLCCNDYIGKYSFGNLNETRLMDLWNSIDYKRIRDEVRTGKFNLPICKRCIGS